MIELYQAEWCPHSHKVRQRLTELGLDFVARQVPADRAERSRLKEETGTDEIPVLVADDGSKAAGEEQIIALLDGRHAERPDAEAHRRKLEEETPFQ